MQGAGLGAFPCQKSKRMTAMKWPEFAFDWFCTHVGPHRNLIAGESARPTGMAAEMIVCHHGAEGAYGRTAIPCAWSWNALPMAFLTKANGG